MSETSRHPLAFNHHLPSTQLPLSLSLSLFLFLFLFEASTTLGIWNHLADHLHLPEDSGSANSANARFLARRSAQADVDWGLRRPENRRTHIDTHTHTYTYNRSTFRRLLPRVSPRRRKKLETRLSDTGRTIRMLVSPIIPRDIYVYMHATFFPSVFYLLQFYLLQIYERFR